eukprot:m.14339 g.14339  ORF g.14339 m.14339 type:complete len:538 (+) comp5066_c0_seq1:1455-3068(+)
MESERLAAASSTLIDSMPTLGDVAATPKENALGVMTQPSALGELGGEVIRSIAEVALGDTLGETDPLSSDPVVDTLVDDFSSGLGFSGAGPSTGLPTEFLPAEKKQVTNESKADTKGKMFVGGLSWETTEEGLRSYFEKFGELSECVVMSNANTGRSRGFGFITFTDPEVTQTVLQNGPHTLDNRTIDPKPAVPKGSTPRGNRTQKGGRNNNTPRDVSNAAPLGYIKTKKIFVGGLTPDTSSEMLKEFFSSFGVVEDIILMVDHDTKRSRGFGFVKFTSEDPVQKLVNLRFVEINSKSVEIKVALPKQAMNNAPRGRNSNRAEMLSQNRQAPIQYQYSGFQPGNAYAPAGYNQPYVNRSTFAPGSYGMEYGNGRSSNSSFNGGQYYDYMGQLSGGQNGYLDPNAMRTSAFNSGQSSPIPRGESYENYGFLGYGNAYQRNAAGYQGLSMAGGMLGSYVGPPYNGVAEGLEIGGSIPEVLKQEDDGTYANAILEEPSEGIPTSGILPVVIGDQAPLEQQEGVKEPVEEAFLQLFSNEES